MVKSKIKQNNFDQILVEEYDKMLQFATDHSETIREVSGIILSNYKFIEENNFHAIEKLIKKLSDEEKRLVDEIENVAPYNTNVPYSNLDYRRIAYYQWGYYEQGYSMVIICVTEGSVETGEYIKVTKLSDHLYVALERFLYT